MKIAAVMRACEFHADGVVVTAVLLRLKSSFRFPITAKRPISKSVLPSLFSVRPCMCGLAQNSQS